MTAEDSRQPDKPAGETEENGAPRPVDDRQAVRNQGEAKPSDYPDRDRAAGEKVVQ